MLSYLLLLSFLWTMLPIKMKMFCLLTVSFHTNLNASVITCNQVQLREAKFKCNCFFCFKSILYQYTGKSSHFLLIYLFYLFNPLLHTCLLLHFSSILDSFESFLLFLFSYCLLFYFFVRIKLFGIQKQSVLNLNESSLFSFFLPFSLSIWLGCGLCGLPCPLPTNRVFYRTCKYSTPSTAFIMASGSKTSQKYSILGCVLVLFYNIQQKYYHDKWITNNLYSPPQKNASTNNFISFQVRC